MSYGYRINEVFELDRNLNKRLHSQPAFYCLFLCKSSHQEFLEYINRNFEKLSKMSGKHIDFYMFNKDMFECFSTDLDDDFDKKVDQACEVFGVHPTRLPAVLLFPSLNSRDCNTFFFEDNAISLLDIFLNEVFNGKYLNLFLPESDRFSKREKNYRSRPLPISSLLSSATRHIRRVLPSIRYQLCYSGEDSIGDQLDYLIRSNQEIKQGMNKILVKLQEIQSEFMPYKLKMQKQLQKLLTLPESEMKESEIEELRADMDEQFWKYTNIISNGQNMPVFLAEYDYLISFEDKSKEMIKSCMKVEELVNKEKLEDFDYSLCAVGYWKAMEIELNIIIVDTIRKLKSIINTIPNTGISNRHNPVKVYAGIRWNERYMVNINKKKDNKLTSLMFGDMLSISENYDNNEFKDIINTIYINNKYYTGLTEFMKHFVNDIREIVNTYRNEYSHTGILTFEELNGLKSRIFEEEGAYFKIALLKKGLLEKLI